MALLTSQIGVGTDSPSFPVDVNNGGIRSFLKTGGTVTRFSQMSPDGALEMYRDAGDPYIDFLSSTSSDYDARIQLQNNGFGFITGGSGAHVQNLTIDAQGKIGIGVTNPTTALDVVVTPGGSIPGDVRMRRDDNLAFAYLSADGALEIRREASLAGGGPYIDFKDAQDSDYDTRIQCDGAVQLKFEAGGFGNRATAAVMQRSGVKIGGTANRATTEGTNQLVIFNGTAPVGTLANGVTFYSASGEARVMDAAGNSTLLSPHDSVTNEWIYDSTYTPTGKRLRIRMEAMMKALNEHFGWDFVEETA